MKKLFLFIIMMFGILSTQSFAWNYVYGGNIPPSVCGADGSKSGNTNSSYTPPENYTNWSAFPFDDETGISSVSNNSISKSTAKDSTLFICQNSGEEKM